MVKVRSVEIPSLPHIEHSSIEMFERDGNVYNGLSYGTREINLVLLIQPEDPNDYDLYVSDVKRAFYTKEECRLFCGDETYYMWCVPDGNIMINELGSGCAEIEVSLTAYDPYWYSTETHVVNNEDKNKFTVDYNSDVPVYPVLSIGFTGDPDKDNYTFCQIENQATGERLLIGGTPGKEGQVIKANSHMAPFPDAMESTEGWYGYTSQIDSGRDKGGTIRITNDGCGLMAEDFGSKSDSAWHGACAYKTLSQPVKNFKVRVRMNHNSTGSNGDPTHPFTNDYQAGTGGSTSTTTTYYYEVTPKVGLRLRKGASTRTAKICTMPKGTKLYPTSISNGWAKVTYNGKTGYCYTQYLAKKVSTSTVVDSGTEAQCNFVVNYSTAIRATPSKSATNKKTIPAGTCVRLYTGTKYCSLCNGKCKITDSSNEKYSEHQNADRFYKMAKAYDGQTGYVLVGKDSEIPSNENRAGKYITYASDYKVDYDYELNTADDKTGVCEIYGYSKNGIQLFRMGMYDDNEYYEFTYPMIRKNGADFLVDKTTAPNAKTLTTYSSGNKKVEKVLSGRYGDWNEFYGELYIERVNNKWYAYVQKISNGQIIKEIKSKTVTDSVNSGESLDHLVIYFGTSGDQSTASCMSITHVEVKTATEIDNTVTYTFQEFEPGDILEIDNSVPEVRLNGKECNELIDVGSNFFSLVPGENTIKVASDDKNLNVDVIWSDKNL